MKQSFSLTKSKLLLALFALLMGASPTWADELTVYDGTNTNEYIPLYGYYADTKGMQSEFILPASDLASIDGAKISGLTFYTSDASASFGNAKFKVYLAEVDATAVTNLYDDTNASTVYEGSLSVASNKMVISFSDNYKYNGGNLLIGIKLTTTGSCPHVYFYGQAVGTPKCSKSWNSITFTPKTTITYEQNISGPGLKVKDYKDGETCAFGMVNPGATRVITLANPGTEDITVNIATTGGFTADITSATIAAKGEQVVTLTAPDATANGTITITPTTTGVDAITLNLSCTIKDPNKMFVDFNDNALPEGWTTAGIGSYTTGNYASTYTWDFSKGYAWYKQSSSWSMDSYKHSLISPLMNFTENEKVLFKMKKEPTSTSYPAYILVQYTSNGTTWTDTPEGAFEDAAFTTDWQTKEVTLPATATQIRFVVAGVGIDDIYGGELSQAPVMKVTASDHVFGMISADTPTTFTIANTGKSELTGVQVTSSDANFTISGDYATVGIGESTTVTVTMSATTKGSHSGVITITAPEQETVTFNVSGYVMDDDLFTETFDDNALPDGWTTTGWTFSNGAAMGAYKSTKYQLITPSLTVAAGEKMAIEVKRNKTNSCTLPIFYSKDGGEFTTLKTIPNSELTDNYQVFFIDGLEAGSYKFRFDGDDTSIGTVNGFHLNQNAPAFEMVTTGIAAFGKKIASDSKTYTVKNAGTGTLTVNIASDNATDFSVAPAQLNIAGGETADFTITFNYIEGSYGNKSANVTVTPTYNEALAYNITATAKAMDPNAWDEDFNDVTVFPTGWVADKFSVAKKSYTTNPNTSNLAVSSDKGATLVTPRLQAKANDVLTWEAYFDWSDEGFLVEYSDDERATWNVVTIDGLIASTASGYKGYYRPEENNLTTRGCKLDMQFTAPADGYYYLRFTSSYTGNGVDNFNGFKLALKEHDATITNKTIRTTFTQYANHQVSVSVKELVGKDEKMTAKFYVNGTQYGESVTETVPAGSEVEFEIPVRFDDIIEGNAYIVVSNANIELTTDVVAITTKAAIVLDETTAPADMPSDYQDKVVVKYTAKQGWNTICLPFALTSDDLTALFGEGWKAYEFNGYSGGELSFNKATKFYAGYPYIVYCANVPEIAAPGYIVTYVYFTSTAKSDIHSGITFQGTFAPMTAGSLVGKYGVTSTGKIQKAGDSATLKGFRAYFEGNLADARLAIYDEATGITTILDAKELNNDENVYNLNGQRVEKAHKGLYIINGKKVNVK